mmetsp:Transcript_4925/g.13972  ORF Transcript_4925/g.13972 Transcript_4925/m.13972 type:complete len:211 (-) Transcript_4925:667-1299(-)
MTLSWCTSMRPSSPLQPVPWWRRNAAKVWMKQVESIAHRKNDAGSMLFRRAMLAIPMAAVPSISISSGWMPRSCICRRYGTAESTRIRSRAWWRSVSRPPLPRCCRCSYGRCWRRRWRERRVVAMRMSRRRSMMRRRRRASTVTWEYRYFLVWTLWCWWMVSISRRSTTMMRNRLLLPPPATCRGLIHRLQRRRASTSYRRVQQFERTCP